MDRARFFLESLREHWKGSRPFQLVVVTRSADGEAVQNALVSGGAVDIRHYSEDFFFSGCAPFYRVAGWWKQQLIKLLVPVQLGFGGYLTFDADNICIRDFDERTFIQEGRLISQWEPKSCQAWWRTTDEWVGIPHDPQGFGLSVTPNSYHGFLTRQALATLAADVHDAVGKLVEAVMASPDIVWAENPFYTATAESRGNLQDYHCLHHQLSPQAPKLHCLQNVWSRQTAGQFFKTPASELKGVFLVVQSTARIPIDRIKAHLRPSRWRNWLARFSSVFRK